MLGWTHRGRNGPETMTVWKTHLTYLHTQMVVNRAPVFQGYDLKHGKQRIADVIERCHAKVRPFPVTDANRTSSAHAFRAACSYWLRNSNVAADFLQTWRLEFVGHCLRSQHQPVGEAMPLEGVSQIAQKGKERKLTCLK